MFRLLCRRYRGVAAGLLAFTIVFYHSSGLNASAHQCENLQFGKVGTSQGENTSRRSDFYISVFDQCEFEAKRGDTDAIAYLGYMYRHGYGTSRDLDIARTWYEKAAENNSKLALDGLAFLRKNDEEDEQEDLLSPNQNGPSSTSNDEKAPEIEKSGVSESDESEAGVKLTKEQESITKPTAVAESDKPRVSDVDIRLAEINCSTGLCRLIDTQVPLKVLPRPFSTLYKQMDSQSEILDSTIPAFTPLFVYERVGVDQRDADSRNGWYRVGDDDKAALGWIKADDLVEWHNALVLSYTPVGVGDEKRNRVIGFSDIDQLRDIAESDDREETAATLFDGIERREPGQPIPDLIKNAGVVSAEPKGVYRDIKDNFYMWPILSWSQPDEEEDERFLEFIQLVPECRKTDDHSSENKTETAGGSTVDVAEYLQGEVAGTKRVEAADVVFVVDTTGSMVPYIEAVKEGILQTAEEISQAYGGVRFGFVGFQDDFEELDYVSRDFFPDGLVDAQAFVQSVEREVQAETWGKHMIPERLFEGLRQGLNAKWRDNSIRFIVVITDAPGIPTGSDELSEVVTETYIALEEKDSELYEHLVNKSIQEAADIGRQASDANLQVFSIFIDPASFPEISAIAEQQLEALPQNENTTDGYTKLDGAGGVESDFRVSISYLASKVADALGKDIADYQDASGALESNSELDKESNPVSIPVDSIVEAAVMEHLGNAKIEDCDYRGWTTDRDLADSAVRALDVNVMLAHHQFDTLYRTVKDIHAALSSGELTGLNFIDSLKSVGTVAISNPEAIERARTGSLSSSGLLPRWLEDLPYHSDIANLSAEDINDMTSADRTQLEVNIGNKIRRYETVIGNGDLWHALSKYDEGKPERRVTPIPLEDLP